MILQYLFYSSCGEDLYLTSFMYLFMYGVINSRAINFFTMQHKDNIEYK